jgi:hypothetical protein
MKKFVFIIFLIGFFCSTGCITLNRTSPYEKFMKTSTPYDVALNNAFRQGFNKGQNEGFTKGSLTGNEIGYDRGFKAGINEGHKSGIKEGIQKKVTEKLLSRLESEFNPKTLGGLKKFYYDNGYQDGRGYGISEAINYNDDSLQQVGYETGYRTGYRKGVEENIKSTKLILTKNYQYTPSEYIPSFDYQLIIDKIKRLNDTVNDINTFDEILKIVHLDFLNFISKQLNFTEVEKEVAKDEYSRIHPTLVKDYFETYNKYYSETNINKLDTFNFYESYYSTDIFIDIVSSGASLVFSGLIALMDLNPALAVFTSVASELIIKPLIFSVLYSFENDLKKYALFTTFNRMVVELESETKEFIKEMVVLKKTYVEDFIYSSLVNFFYFFNAEAEVKLKVFATIFYGYNLDKIRFSLDHEKQEFIVFFPELEVLDTPHLKYVFEYVHDSYGLDLITDKFLNGLFRQAEQKAIDKANEVFNNKHSDLYISAEKQAISAVQKLFYPVISFPKPFYKIYISINGRLINVYDKLM